jgi:hypothetical protein
VAAQLVTSGVVRGSIELVSHIKYIRDLFQFRFSKVDYSLSLVAHSTTAV